MFYFCEILCRVAIGIYVKDIPVVVNAIKRLTNDRDNKKYIVLDLQLPATIDPAEYKVDPTGLFNMKFPLAVSSNSGKIDITALQTVRPVGGGDAIGTDGFYITPTMRYTTISGDNGETSTMKEYVVLDNNGGNPEDSYGNIPENPYEGNNMIYLERTTSSSGSTVAATVTELSTNIRGLMFRIHIPWTMSIFYNNMSEQTQKEYDKLVLLMDNLTRFTDMRLDWLDDNYENPKFEALVPFKNYAQSDGGAAIALTMAGSLLAAGISILGDVYWRFFPGGFVLINHGDPSAWADKKIRLTLAYDA